MKNFTKWMLAAAVAVGGLGLTAAPAKAAQIGIYIGAGPNYIPSCPGPGYVWIAGYYSNGYWIPGQWVFQGVVANQGYYGNSGYYSNNFYGDRDDYRNNDRDDYRNNDRDDRGSFNRGDDHRDAGRSFNNRDNGDRGDNRGNRGGDNGQRGNHGRGR